jgi:hypothetical protein
MGNFGSSAGHGPVRRISSGNLREPGRTINVKTEKLEKP